MVRFGAVAVLVMLAGCGATGPQSTASPALDSGVTSSSGGGQRALGNLPNTGVTTSTTPAR